MKYVIVAYDLKDVQDGDNHRVKEALLESPYAYNCARGQNRLAPFVQNIICHLPDTTVIFQVTDTMSNESIADAIVALIESVGAQADKVYVSAIKDYFVWNSDATRLALGQR